MSTARSEIKARMFSAFRKGQSVTSFMRDMRLIYPKLYRKTVLLADWRTTGQIEAKKGLMRYIRKDRYPTAASMVVFETTKKIPEYMYTIRVKSVIHPGEPVDKQYVNIFSDVPMTPDMVTQAVVEKWAQWEDYTAIALEEPVIETAYRTIKI